MGTAYVVDSCVNGVTCVFDNRRDAERYILGGLIAEAQYNYGCEDTTDAIASFCNDLKSLFEDGYVEGYAWIIEADLNPEIRW